MQLTHLLGQRPLPCFRHNVRTTVARLSLAPRSRQHRALPRRIAASASATQTEPQLLSSQTHEETGINIQVYQSDDSFDVDVSVSGDRPDLVLHWAVEDWSLPPKDTWPAGTVQAGDLAVQTSFGSSGKIHLSFNAETCPSRVVFVLKEGEKWFNSGAGDFQAYLKPPGVREVAQKVLEAESEYTHWSLFNRFCLASELLDAAIAAGPEGMALMLTWLRLSSMRQLDWYRNSNYQSKDAAHVQKTIAQRMADKARSAPDPWCRLFARNCLQGLPRGGGNGDDIRMGILHIMRDNGIREGHRPGIEDQFLESWHQKLHTNTTPEDIAICEGYLAFLHSNNMDDFWRVLWDVGRLTPQMLETMDHPIKPTPFHLPHMIPAFQHYLWILKTTHAGADLDVMLEMARGSMDGDLAWMIGDILANRNEWWVPGKLVEARHRLKEVWMREGASRDVLLLDIAMDNYFRLCIERADKGSMSGDDLINLVQLVLDNASVSAESEELVACGHLWRRMSEAPGRWESKNWGLLALAAADNVAQCLEAYADRMASLIQPHADAFGEKCKIDPLYITNFSEEVVRSQPVFMLSVLLKFLNPYLRSAADVGPWQVVSQAPASGTVMILEDLSTIQGKSFEDSPVVVFAEKLTGNEDIPLGVQAVLTTSATDVLSHVAIRARAQSVLLATCFDGDLMEGLKVALAGKYVEAGVLPSGDVGVTEVAAPSGAKSGAAAAGGAAGKKVKLVKAPASTSSDKWVLSESEFIAGAVGGKSRNLAALRGKLPDWINVPSSIALPFGTFERVLADPANKAAAAAIAAAEADLAAFLKKSKGSGVPDSLKTLREIVRTQLIPPAALIKEAAAAAAAAGLISKPAEWTTGSEQWTAAWSAICKVWASKWNDRAWLSRVNNNIPDADLSMAVLVQTVVPSAYSFVLHTADPLTGEAGALRGELAVGMGEALVGNFPGRPLGFSAKDGLLGLPSKREALLPVPGPAGGKLLIARSDSNGEDLEDFAGAGLYSSVPLVDLERVAVRYCDEPLLWDDTMRSELLKKVSELGVAVEAAFGSAQDVEGSIDGDGKLFVVQSRAQV